MITLFYRTWASARCIIIFIAALLMMILTLKGNALETYFPDFRQVNSVIFYHEVLLKMSKQSSEVTFVPYPRAFFPNEQDFKDYLIVYDSFIKDGKVKFTPEDLFKPP